ncbi:glucosaminidase domain-containing protein [Psychrilyobacter atlanticus]|uniref:glucosaminidase domain-containing protein n=1 Tax=Psychrilyobacter atlanticus TaxID=271091 RepID=UPI00041348BF|nr:glucosaminidase domain-containing protein [Psychrilyobacter atlanticus]
MGIKLFLLYLIVVIINFSQLEDRVVSKNTESIKIEKIKKQEKIAAEQNVKIRLEIKKMVKGTYKEIDLLHLSDVQPIPGEKLVPRVVYSMDNVSLRGLNVPNKKQKFFEIMVPTAMIVVEEIEETREGLKLIMEGKKERDEEYLSKMYAKYRVKEKDIEVLYHKLKPVPISILLSQAILESGWGTSRFFEKANNIFGVWSVDPTEPRIKAGEARVNKQVYLRSYPTLKESMADYMKLLARHKAYSRFREKLQVTDDYKVLVPKLDKYSEMEEVYISRLLATIEHNKLYQYDRYEFE